MPTYEYLCDACGQKFEIEQRITEAPIKKCIHCAKAKARRLITQGNFILKGGGWYSDLYSSSSAPKPKKGSEAPSGKDVTPEASTAEPSIKKAPKDKSAATSKDKPAKKP
ncbi:MAG: zinc ribbon domain-containing protein [Myxococcales bacterium]|nr:zinc ribbon domain-containing protein [Myxococcales bacterium]